MAICGHPDCDREAAANVYGQKILCRAHSSWQNIIAGQGLDEYESREETISRLENEIENIRKLDKACPEEAEGNNLGLFEKTLTEFLGDG